MSSDPDRARQAYEDDCKDDATSGIDLYALFVLDATIPTTVRHNSGGNRSACIVELWG